MKESPAIEFNTPSRIHIGLGVKNLRESVAFYRLLFEQEPTKVREGYAKFEVPTPSINLSLNEIKKVSYPQSPGAFHYGIQVKSTEEVLSAIQRFSTAKLETIIEEKVTCCYAEQDKVWITDPDGNKWEVFVVLGVDAEKKSDETNSKCCVGTT